MYVKRPTQKKRQLPLLAAAVCLLMLIPGKGAAFDKRLQLGLYTGFSATYLRDDNNPNLFNGLPLGGYIEYGFNRVFAISIEGAADLHFPSKYYQWEWTETLDDESGELTAGWGNAKRVDRYIHSTGAFSVLYAIDLFRIVPVFSLGFVAAREDKRIEGKTETERFYGFRIGGGFEYYLKRFSFGAGLYSDRYIGNRDKELVNRISITLRGAYFFDFGAKILE